MEQTAILSYTEMFSSEILLLPAQPSSKQLDKQEQKQWWKMMQHKDQRPDITQYHLESIKAIHLY